MVSILASHAADRGSIPGCGRSVSHQTVSGTATAGDAHSLARRIDPPPASKQACYGVAQDYRKGGEHLRRSRSGKRPGLISCIVGVVVSVINYL